MLSLTFIPFLLLSSAFAQDDPLSGLSSKFRMSERMKAQEKLLDMGPTVIPLLRQGLKYSDESIKIESIKLLGELKAKQAVPDLLEILKNATDTRTVSVTAHVLGQIQDKRATPEFINMASSVTGDIVRRRASIIALGLLGDKSAVPVLENILTEDNELLKVFAAGSLGLLGSQKGLDSALGATASPDYSLRKHAIQALGLIGSNKAMNTLNDLLRKKPLYVERETITLSQFQISLKGLTKQEKISSIKTRLLLKPTSTMTTKWYIRELINIGGPNAKAALEEIAQKHPDNHIRFEVARNRKVLNIIEKMQIKGNQ